MPPRRSDRAECQPVGKIMRRSAAFEQEDAGESRRWQPESSMRAIMYSFGAHEQDVDGNLTINSKETLEALKFVKALFEETETPEVFAWDPSSNNRQMLAGRSSLVLNAISVTRTGENDKMPIHEKIALAKPAKGPVRRIGLEHVMDCYVIWKFSDNIDGAKKFLVDYIDNFKQGFMASEFYNFPCFSKTVPDLTADHLQGSQGRAAGQVRGALDDVLDWATNVGYPGYCQRGDRRNLQHLGDQHDVRRGCGGRRDSGERSQAGGRQDEGDLGQVERPKDDLIVSPRIDEGSRGVLSLRSNADALAPKPFQLARLRRLRQSEAHFMAIVETRRITKLFDEVRAVDGIDLIAKEGEFLVLLGPSGCGKTTLMRMIAGLERPTSGDIVIDGNVVNDLPPRARNVAMVFQSYALYPHLTVERNISFPLRAVGMPRDEIRKKVDWAAQMFGIQALPRPQAASVVRR